MAGRRARLTAAVLRRARGQRQSSDSGRVVGMIALRVLAGMSTTLILLGLLALFLILAAFGAADSKKGVTGGGGAAGACAIQAGDDSEEGLPVPMSELESIYQQAATTSQYALGPRGPFVLKAINRIETKFGREVHTSNKGAGGWMQFMPNTWNAYKIDADGGGADISNPRDAIHSAANYLHANLESSRRKRGGAEGDYNDADWHAAVFAYNHADWYVDDVLSHADTYQGQCSTVTLASNTTTTGKAQLLPDGTVTIPANAPPNVKLMIAAANKIANKPYKWGGGHPPNIEDNGYDCSGYTMYALRAAGFVDSKSNLVAKNFMNWGEPGKGQWVTIYAHATHVYMVIAGIRFDSGGTGRPGSAWRANMLSDEYVQSSRFVAVHPPGL